MTTWSSQWGSLETIREVACGRRRWGRAALRAAQASVAKEACGSRYDDFAAACPCRAVVKRLGAKAVADTTLAAALAAKVVIYGASPSKASECCLALAALQPGLVSLGLTQSLDAVNPRLHVHAFRWRNRGFPLLDYAAWPVQPSRARRRL